MAKKLSRTIPANDFIAESLEEEANRLPPSREEQAKMLRKSAEIYRSLPSRNSVRIWVEAEDFSQAAARIVREATKD
jgi:hypothetical protein